MSWNGEIVINLDSRVVERMDNQHRQEKHVRAKYFWKARPLRTS
jgi:hypothetical protein